MVRRTPREELPRGPLFSACAKKELQLIARRAEHVDVPAGKVLVREGAAGAEFFVILDGTAEVSRHGRRVATLDPAPRNATVTAKTPMQLMVLGQREFATMIDDVPEFAHKLLTGLAHRLRE